MGWSTGNFLGVTSTGRDLIVLAMNDKEKKKEIDHSTLLTLRNIRQDKDVWLQLLLAPVENMAGVWP